jgi:hypothetical protein
MEFGGGRELIAKRKLRPHDKFQELHHWLRHTPCLDNRIRFLLKMGSPKGFEKIIYNVALPKPEEHFLD